MQLIVTGRVAELEPVPKAVMRALHERSYSLQLGLGKPLARSSYLPMLKMNVIGLERVTAK